MIADSLARRLCERAAKGDLAAGSELLREFRNLIFAYHRRLSRNDEDAADLTQVTFSRVWRSMARFRGASSVSTWIHRIAYCCYVDWARQSRPPTQQTEEWWQEIAAADRTPFEQSAERDASRRLYAAVDKLPEENRQAIHLHYYQGLSLAETAEVLEVPESTLKYRLRNALERLRRQLKEPFLIHNFNGTES
jgi:RNA polymerase sigma-70 factor (ECF subfamily)